VQAARDAVAAAITTAAAQQTQVQGWMDASEPATANPVVEYQPARPTGASHVAKRC
jgi:hypothetical protein